MSDVESYYGKLVPVDTTGFSSVDEWIMNKLGMNELGYYRTWFEALDDKYWKDFHYDQTSSILYSIEKERFDPEEMAKFYRNSDGTYDFTVSFYNGGTYLGEVLQEGLDNLNDGRKTTQSTHHVLFNGYQLGDRLLEDVFFKVSLKVDGVNAEVVNIVPDQTAYPYLNNIRWENFVEAIHNEVQHNIDYLKNVIKTSGSTFEEEFKKFENEAGIANGAQLLLEI